jgi:hypothetical protein
MAEFLSGLGETCQASTEHADKLTHFFLTEKGRLVRLGPAGRTTDWISVELISRVTSGFEILGSGRLGAVQRRPVVDAVQKALTGSPS